MDTERFQTLLRDSTADLPDLPLETEIQIDQYVARLIEETRRAAIETTPICRSSLYDKAFWTPECKTAVDQASHLRWIARRKRDLGLARRRARPPI